MFAPRLMTITSASLCISALCVFSGCGESSGRYPNDDPNTKARIDAIHNDTKIELDKASQELADTEQNLDFRAKQAKDKADRKRAEADLAYDKKAQPWKNQIDAAQKQFTNERAQVKADTEVNKQKSAPDQFDTLDKDSAHKITAINKEETERVSELQSKIAKQEAEKQQRLVEINSDHNEALAEIEKERTAARNSFRENKIKIEAKGAENLNKFGENTDADRAH